VSLLDRVRSVLGRGAGDTIRVHLLLKGKIGAGWYDVDRELRVPAGTTLDGFIAAAEREGIRLRDALEHSPHLRHTLMLNGDRCDVDENAGRVLADGDEIYLLAPLAGG